MKRVVRAGDRVLVVRMVPSRACAPPLDGPLAIGQIVDVLEAASDVLTLGPPAVGSPRVPAWVDLRVPGGREFMVGSGLFHTCFELLPREEA